MGFFTKCILTLLLNKLSFSPCFSYSICGHKCWLGFSSRLNFNLRGSYRDDGSAMPCSEHVDNRHYSLLPKMYPKIQPLITSAAVLESR